MPSRLLSDIKELLRPESAPNRAIPALDGGLTPNDALHGFTCIANLPEVEDLVEEGPARVLVTAGTALWRVDLESGETSQVAQLPGRGLGLCRSGEGVLVCVAGAGLLRVTAHGDVTTVATLPAGDRGDLMSVVVLDDDVYVTRGSTTHGVDDWPRDLMGKGRTGALLKVRPDGRMEPVVDGLQWAYGACVVGDEVVVCESWAHQVIAWSPATGRTRVLRNRLPGYPARVKASSDGGVWLAMLALRTYLVEFVLREDGFRKRMIAEVPMKDWIRPATHTTNTVREPLQLGGVRHLGETKPWAPPRSYGLVAEMDRDGDFRRSYHSRPGRHRHGTTACLETGGRLVVLARGSGEVLVQPDDRGETTS